MELLYDHPDLHRLAVDAAFQLDGLPPEAVRSYRCRLQSLLAARDRHDLSKVLSLELRSENGHEGARSSIHVADGLRLMLDFDRGKADEVMVVGFLRSDALEVKR